jgi:hypothetical protein
VQVAVATVVTVATTNPMPSRSLSVALATLFVVLVAGAAESLADKSDFP